MKRQGRQHGMVRTYPILSAPYNPRPSPRNPNELSSPPTAGHFTKVSTKPTNHSKFTGKCGRPKCRDCHCRPAGKSRDKIKGAHKIKSSSEDVVMNCRLITWRVAEPTEPGLKISGFSATGVLDYLGKEDCMDRDYDYDYDYEDDVDECCDYGVSSSNAVEIEEIDDEDDDGMSFCEVGFVLEQVDGGDDGSWFLVEEM